ncbi:MAG: alpha/beta hydrolase fold domain-containing protein [Flavobacteriales bacterium]|nr:alpha/beta hydrolase fold domain-containing protein [Flavobacteriales bacterium]
MIRKFALLTLIISQLSAISQCEDGRYRDFIFPDYIKTSDVEYGFNYDLNGAGMPLFMDIYEPLGDLEQQRPLVVLAHGGSFIGGSKEGLDIVPLCEDLARMGYVTASIQYRLGIPITLALEEPATEAVMRGYHDMKAAIRYFRQNAEMGGNTYAIDESKIFIGGSSAGAFIALHVAYLDEENEIPDFLDLNQLGLTGGLEGDSGNPDYSSEVSGVFNIAGALGDSAWVKSNDEPLCSFHGTNDETVPFGSEMLQMFGTFDVMEVDGSASVSMKAEAAGITQCFEIYEDQGHVPHVSNIAYYDTTLSITSNFLSHLVCPEIDLDCDYRSIQESTSIGETNLSQLVGLAPNPAKDHVVCTIPDSWNDAFYRIYNLQGQLIESNRLTSNSTQIQTSKWAPGLYQLMIVNEDKAVTKQLIVE